MIYSLIARVWLY